MDRRISCVLLVFVTAVDLRPGPTFKADQKDQPPFYTINQPCIRLSTCRNMRSVGIVSDLSPSESIDEVLEEPSNHLTLTPLLSSPSGSGMTSSSSHDVSIVNNVIRCPTLLPANQHNLGILFAPSIIIKTKKSSGYYLISSFFIIPFDPKKAPRSFYRSKHVYGLIFWSEIRVRKGNGLMIEENNSATVTNYK